MDFGVLHASILGRIASALHIVGCFRRMCVWTLWCIASLVHQHESMLFSLDFFISIYFGFAPCNHCRFCIHFASNIFGIHRQRHRSFSSSFLCFAHLICVIYVSVIILMANFSVGFYCFASLIWLLPQFLVLSRICISLLDAIFAQGTHGSERIAWHSFLSKGCFRHYISYLRFDTLKKQFRKVLKPKSECTTIDK